MSDTLDAARASMARATRRVSATAAGEVAPVVTGDPDADQRLADAVAELDRPLSATEHFNVVAGLPHDYAPEPERQFPVEAELLHPEEQLRRQLAAKEKPA